MSANTNPSHVAGDSREPAAKAIADSLAAVRALPDPQPCALHPDRVAEFNGVIAGRVLTLCVECATMRTDVSFPWAEAQGQ